MEETIIAKEKYKIVEVLDNHLLSIHGIPTRLQGGEISFQIGATHMVVNATIDEEIGNENICSETWNLSILRDRFLETLPHRITAALLSVKHD